MSWCLTRPTPSRRAGEHEPFLEPAPLGRGGETSDDWFLYLAPERYDDLLGLTAAPDAWIA